MKNENKKDKFNLQEYKTQYNKNNYVSISIKVKKNVLDKLNNYCEKNNITKTEFIKNAISQIND